MKTEVITVSPDTTMPELQRLFLSARVGALPVLDRERKLKGICSRSDVIRQFALEQSMAEHAERDFDPISGKEDDESDANALDAIGSAVGRRLSKMRARDILVTKVTTVTSGAPLEHAADLMVKQRIHRLPVVDDDKLVGIISAFDFMRLYASGQTPGD